MKYDAIAIHFGEIWLKGRNRGAFVKRLYRNIMAAIEGESFDKLVNERDRLMLYLSKDSDIERIESSLGRVFGVSWYAPVLIVTNKIPDILKAGKAVVNNSGVEKVKISASRSYKGLSYDSTDVVSAFLKDKKLGFDADKNSEHELNINIRANDALLRMGKIKGRGGLPVGSSGKAVILLSGGIDSPLSAFYAMKKGLIPIYLHIHAFPSNDIAEKSKIGSIVSMLSRYSNGAKIYYVPAHVFQAHTVKIPKSHELVLFKYFAYMLAEQVAKKEGAKVIVTGESLAQVASQTVDNLIASEQDTKLFIMRPLIGFDKQQIINEAKNLGTYELSIQEYPDVCSFRARHPSTAANASFVKKLVRSAKLRTALGTTLRKSISLDVGM